MKILKFRSFIDNKYYYSHDFDSLSEYFKFTSNFEQEQFIGILSKNDDEIYEGDIIKYYYVHQTTPIIGYVKWSKGGYHIVVEIDTNSINNNKVLPFPCQIELLDNINENKKGYLKK